MSFLQSFQLALKNIMLSKVRSLLTMLGIIIGVGAVIVIVGMGNGMKIYMTDSFKSMGTNLLTVYIMGTSSSNVVKDKDMYALLDKNPEYFSNVSPLVSVSGTVKIGSKFLKQTTVTGTSEAYGGMKKMNVTGGRYLQYIDIAERKNVCVVGSYITKEWFNGNAIGQKISINGNTFEIVGTIGQDGDGTEGGSDDVVYVPYTVALRIIPNENATHIASDDYGMAMTIGTTNYSIEARSEENIAQAKTAIESYLFSVYKSREAYKVMSMAEILNEMTTELNVIIIILTTIAAISLFVGGIGIMNIMLISVSERTKEIGIRKSLGAKQRHIMRQFVIEAATTSALGGIAGIGLGYVLSSIGTQVISSLTKENIKVVPSANSVLTAFLISAGIGILFGYLPAKKAARLNPIDALRYE